MTENVKTPVLEDCKVIFIWIFFIGKERKGKVLL